MMTTQRTSKLDIVMCQNYSGPTTGLRFAVKILKQYSENLFLIADKSGLCEMSLEDTKPLHRLLLVKNNCVRIVNPEVKPLRQTIYIHRKTSVFQIKELRNVKVPKRISKQNENDSQTKPIQNDDDDKTACDGCQTILDKAALLRHISHTRKCKEVYGDRYITMLAKSKKLSQKKKYQQNASKICKANKTRYHANSDKIKNNYRENKSVISERRKKKYKEKKEIEDQEINDRLEDLKLYQKSYQPPTPLSNSILPYAVVKEVKGKVSVDKRQAVCEKCGYVCQIKGFLTHVNQKKDCLEFYGDRLEEMRKERRKQVKQKNYGKYERVKRIEKKAKEEERKQKSLKNLLEAFEKIKESKPKRARENNENGKEESKKHLEAIEYLRKSGTLCDETKKRLTNIESEIESFYSNNEKEISKGIEKIKDLKCEPYPCKIETGHWWRDESTETIENIFWPDFDPMYIKKNWFYVREKVEKSIRSIHKELKVECYFCKPNPAIGCLVCRSERKKNGNKVKNDLEKEAEDDQGDNYEPPKPRRGGIWRFVFPSIRDDS